MMNSEMTANTNVDEGLKPIDFYSPICKSGYLTPLQRKKLREKRNTSPPLGNDNDFKTPKSSKGTKKRNASTLKTKVKSVKELHHRKRTTKENLPQLRCSLGGLVSQDQTVRSYKEKRFFKNRSPSHLKKAEFVIPLIYKKRRLDFSNEKNTILAPLQPIQNVRRSPLNRITVSLEIKEKSVNSKADTQCDPSFAKSPEKKQVVEINLAPFSSIQNPESDELVEEVGGLFNIDWLSDKELLKRQNKARALLRESLSAAAAERQRPVPPDATENQHASSPKLYSIFSKLKEEKESNIKKSSQKRTSMGFHDTSKGSDQMIIDAGQKEIGAKLCKTCNMLYTIGQQEDENLHSRYHHMFLINLKFPGWKNERVVGQFEDGRIIQICNTDKNFKLKKVQDVLFIANRDLGFQSAEFPSKPNVMFFLFISNDKRVGGCLVAESIDFACPVVLDETSERVNKNSEKNKSIWKLGNWYASTQTVPAICGINRIWVSLEFRRNKVASRLVDCLRGNFIYGHVITLKELAFTDPSPVGREFAASYTKTDDFLVYK